MAKSTLHNTHLEAPRAFLVGINLPQEKNETTIEHLRELSLLAETRGISVLETFIQQRQRPDRSTFIGKGKVESLATRIKAEKIDQVIFDDELSPSQVKNLEKCWGCQVLDRSLLILDIFAMRAQTAQAKVQVELAQYQYLLPRLRGMWSHHSRQKGGSARMKGPGEKELETDKRIAQRKIHLLKKELAAITQQGETQRQQRKKTLSVALVGYTNAGKSTLMKAITQKEIPTANQLFATLTTTIRKVTLQELPFLLVDTVGFIRKLPHTLIEAFKATLMEVNQADLILHVVDVAHPQHQAHIQVVHDTLQTIGAHHIPKVLILNKQDQVQIEGKPLALQTQAVQHTYFQAQKTKYEKEYGQRFYFCTATEAASVKKLCQNLHPLLVNRYKSIAPYKKPSAP